MKKKVLILLLLVASIISGCDTQDSVFIHADSPGVLKNNLVNNINQEWNLNIKDDLEILFYRENESNDLGQIQSFAYFIPNHLPGGSCNPIEYIGEEEINRIKEIEELLEIDDDNQIDFKKIKYYTRWHRDKEIDGVKAYDRFYILLEDFHGKNSYIIEDMNRVVG